MWASLENHKDTQPGFSPDSGYAIKCGVSFFLLLIVHGLPSMSRIGNLSIFPILFIGSEL